MVLHDPDKSPLGRIGQMIDTLRWSLVWLNPRRDPVGCLIFGGCGLMLLGLLLWVFWMEARG